MIGIGKFSIAELAFKGFSCSACGDGIEDDKVNGIGLFDCAYSVDGAKLKDPKKLPKRANMEAFEIELCYTKKDKIEKYFASDWSVWAYMNITTEKLE